MIVNEKEARKSQVPAEIVAGLARGLADKAINAQLDLNALKRAVREFITELDTVAHVLVDTDMMELANEYLVRRGKTASSGSRFVRERGIMDRGKPRR
jgi:hypothetical protein